MHSADKVKQEKKNKKLSNRSKSSAAAGVVQTQIKHHGEV